MSERKKTVGGGGGAGGKEMKLTKKTKAVKEKDRSDDANKGMERNVDILDDSAMENALNICHNVQDLLFFRGFFWNGDNGGKGKARKAKKGKGK